MLSLTMSGLITHIQLEISKDLIPSLHRNSESLANLTTWCVSACAECLSLSHVVDRLMVQSILYLRHDSVHVRKISFLHLGKHQGSIDMDLKLSSARFKSMNSNWVSVRSFDHLAKFLKAWPMTSTSSIVNRYINSHEAIFSFWHSIR